MLKVIILIWFWYNARNTNYYSKCSTLLVRNWLYYSKHATLHRETTQLDSRRGTFVFDAFVFAEAAKIFLDNHNQLCLLFRCEYIQ